jgi:hypothetical protein
LLLVVGACGVCGAAGPRNLLGLSARPPSTNPQAPGCEGSGLRVRARISTTTHNNTCRLISLSRTMCSPVNRCGIHGLSPTCMTRLVAEPDPTYIRSLFKTAAPTSRLRRTRAQEDETILGDGCSSHASSVHHLDPPGLIGSWKLEKFGCDRNQAVMTAPSMTTPALTYFHSATNSLRASATIVCFFRRPSFCFTRCLNHRLSAESG